MTTDIRNFPELLRQHGITPKKSLGQNFLFDENIINSIVDLASITSETTVLEIGAGPGNLTNILAEHAKRVVAVELDQRFLPLLELVGSHRPNLEIIHGNILKLDLDQIMGKQGYVVVANLPYYITSAVIRKLLETRLKPARLVLTVQKEVAVRICAKAGEMSLLSVSVQVFGEPRLAAHIPAGAFFPPPKVDSSVLLIDTYSQPIIPVGQLTIFFQLVKAGFSQKRKMLRNTLSAGMRLSIAECELLLRAAGIDPARRAQTLELDEWARLTGIYISQILNSDA
ncbi:MAG: 16S rRNA (adenine(1518)-N(6)/adenine(1519)-N(6))-dimethyltransferase RsmA [Anaerolineaceae bacterium]